MLQQRRGEESVSVTARVRIEQADQFVLTDVTADISRCSLFEPLWSWSRAYTPLQSGCPRLKVHEYRYETWYG